MVHLFWGFSIPQHVMGFSIAQVRMHLIVYDLSLCFSFFLLSGAAPTFTWSHLEHLTAYGVPLPVSMVSTTFAPLCIPCLSPSSYLEHHYFYRRSFYLCCAYISFCLPNNCFLYVIFHLLLTSKFICLLNVQFVLSKFN